MLICGHHIAAAEIVGIGPLMYTKTGELKQLFFYVYLKMYPLKLESPVYDMNSFFELQYKENSRLYNDFMKEYNQCAALIARRIAARERAAGVRATAKKTTSITKT